MRELTLLDTGYLSGLLLISLVLPLMMSFRGPQGGTPRRFCMRIVWVGQLTGALAGFGVLASARLAPFAAASGLMMCIGCAVVLWRFQHVTMSIASARKG